MSRMRGERFQVDLSDDEDELPARQRQPRSAVTSDRFGTFVKDVQERSTESRPPTAPSSVRTLANGFPVPTKRMSKFKQAKATQNSSSTSTEASSMSPASTTTSRHLDPYAPSNNNVAPSQERHDIDAENKERLARMAPEEIEQEQHELLQGLPPSLIERLLKRSTIDDPTTVPKSADHHDHDPLMDNERASRALAKQAKPAKRVAFQDTKLASPPKITSPTPIAAPSPALKPLPVETLPSPLEPKWPAVQAPSTSSPHNDDVDVDIDIDNAASYAPSTLPSLPTIHFPLPPPITPLDPSSETFLTDLHTKYFPTLASDPAKLAWMTPSPTPPAYLDPSTRSLPVSDLRFSFTGALLAPSASARIPVTAGLHHHGDAPDAAGYTLPELAHLSRSAFPAQRCVAFLTLGRVLFRLGRGEFGVMGGVRRDGVVRDVHEGCDDDVGEEDGTDRGEGEDEGVLAAGMWRCVEEGRVVETLETEAARTGGHMSAKAHATEALWLWQRGGGRRWKAE